MRSPLLLPMVLLFLSPTLAGCIMDDDTAPTVTTAPELDPLRAEGVTDRDLLWVPTLESLPDFGPETREWLKGYAQTYANRISFTPINTMATDFLMEELASYGYTVELKTYYPELAPVATEPVGYDVIVATKLGTVEPERHIGLVAHHDALYTSNEAAYDDGSGTAVVLALAKYFATVDTRKSVTALLFDGEEMGLRSSCYYVNEIAATGTPQYDIVFGYDMIGINWPGHEWHMYHMMGDEDDLDTLLPMVEHVYRDQLNLSHEGVAILGEHDRNSDERRFRDAGLPIFRWAGGRHASDYPHYHEPTDTYDNMIAFAGGEKNFEMGIDMAVKTSVAMFHAADQWAFPEYTLNQRDCSFYGPSDGPL